jgi:hypothetical protein
MAVGERFITHEKPLWAERIDSAVFLNLAPWGLDGVEKLPSRRAENLAYELCCLPFFSYGFRLGDIVEATAASSDDDSKFVARVLRPSNRINIRLVVRVEKETEAAMRRIEGILAQAECGWEIWQPGYVAADVPTAESERVVLQGLHALVEYRILSIERI